MLDLDDFRVEGMHKVKVRSDFQELRPTKIVCLLRSYAAHAEELGNEVPGRPRIFLKPPSSLIPDGSNILIPEGVSKLHHEIELAMVIGRKGKDIPEGSAMEHVAFFLPMLDITARDVQDEAKSKGLPWTEAKGYDTFAPFGPEAVPASEYDWRSRRIWLRVNGVLKQDGNTDLLLFPPSRIISEISRIMTLEVDDIIMTGTPAGVGPLVEGDIVEAGIDGIEPMRFRVVKEDRD
jgi:2-keto-4-pentenoate hydratase/2-oxohepta-3-ene-1,7-dioic acid hydratase in catechol pathway